MMRRRFFLDGTRRPLHLPRDLRGCPRKETYQVQPGDTLVGIAAKISITANALKAANPLKGSQPQSESDPHHPLSEDQKDSKSSHPSPPQDEVYSGEKKGDTLAGIARKTGVPVAKLREINRHREGPADRAELSP